MVWNSLEHGPRSLRICNMQPKRSSRLPLDTPGAWGSSELGLFNLVGTEPGGSMQPGPGDILEAPKLVVIFKSAASAQKFRRRDKRTMPVF